MKTFRHSSNERNRSYVLSHNLRTPSTTRLLNRLPNTSKRKLGAYAAPGVRAAQRLLAMA